MTTQIDNLVRGIHHDLAQPSPAVPELAAFFQTIGADGLSKAVAQRAILGRWAEDVTLTSDVIFRRRLHQTTRFEGCCAVVY